MLTQDDIDRRRSRLQWGGRAAALVLLAMLALIVPWQAIVLIVVLAGVVWWLGAMTAEAGFVAHMRAFGAVK